MKYKQSDFTEGYYRLWQAGLALPPGDAGSVYSVNFSRDDTLGESRVTLRALSVSDARERACFAVAAGAHSRPEDINVSAVLDAEENILWLDEPLQALVQKKNEFRGMERREFLLRVGAGTAAALLFGIYPRAASGQQIPFAFRSKVVVVAPEQLYTSAGSFSWVVPSGVTSVCVICIGGGGGFGAYSSPYAGCGGAGAGLRYKNNIAVTPGASITVVVGAYGRNASDAGTPSGGEAGGNSSFSSTSVLWAGGGGGGSSSLSSGGGGIGGTGIALGGGIGGGNGGNGGYATSGQIYRTGFGGGYYDPRAGGGGTGGYSGNGGTGGNSIGGSDTTDGTAGSGGGSGGGGGGTTFESGGGGGGTGLYGTGSNGAGGVAGHNTFGNAAGLGGSSGSNGDLATAYGGGSCGYPNARTGAVRIIWGAGKSFPSAAS